MRMKNDFHIKGYPRFETEAWGTQKWLIFLEKKLCLKSANTTLKFYLIFNLRIKCQKQKTFQPPIYHFLSATKACYKANFWMLALGVQKGINNIHHFHIHHNAPCLPSKFCITIAFDFLGTTVILRRNWKK